MFLILTTNGYENKELAKAITDQGVPTKVLKAEDVFYKFAGPYNDASPLWYGGDNLKPSHLLVRSSDNAKNMLGRVANLMGVITVDPYNRFQPKKSPKMSSEVYRFFESGEPNQPSSYCAFSKKGVTDHLNLFVYPLVHKPVNGRHGQGVYRIDDERALLRAVDEFVFNDRAILFQQYLDKLREYRVISYRKDDVTYIINFAKKFLPKGDRKEFGGRRFDRVDMLPDDIVDYIKRYVKPGLIGLDICRTTDRRIWFIEQNRAPEFEHIDRATGLNTAALLMEKIC